MNGSESSSWPTATAHSFAQTADNPTPGQTGGTTLAGAAEMLWPTPMAGTPAQNGNSAAGNSDFTRKMDALIDNWTTPQAHDVTMRGAGQVPTSKAGNACLARDAAMWFTPNVPNGGRTLKEGTSPTGMTPDGIKRQVGLENQVVLWGTPRASDAEKGGPNQAFGAGGTPLPAQAAQWPTPQSRDIRMGDNPDSPRQTRKADQGWSQNLNDVGENWPTPAARDHKGENGTDHLTNGTGRLHMDQLPNAVAHGFSRPDHQTWPDGLTLSQLRRIWRPLRASVIASHGRPTWRRLWKSRAKRRLNPEFVGWLMGWPPGHALCDCSAMEFARWQQDMRGALSQMPTASGPWIWKPTIEEPQAVQMVLI